MSYININHVLFKLQYHTPYTICYMTDQHNVMCGRDGRQLFWLRSWWCPWQNSSVRCHNQSRNFNITRVLLAYAPRLMVKIKRRDIGSQGRQVLVNAAHVKYVLTQFITATMMCIFLLNCYDHIRLMFRHEPSCLKDDGWSRHKMNGSIWCFNCMAADWPLRPLAHIVPNLDLKIRAWF